MSTRSLVLAAVGLSVTVAVVVFAQTPATVPATQPTTQAVAAANAVLTAMKAKYNGVLSRQDGSPYIQQFCSKAGPVPQQDCNSILNAFFALRSTLAGDRPSRPFGAKIFHVATTKNGKAILTDATLTLPAGSSTPIITFP